MSPPRRAALVSDRAVTTWLCCSAIEVGIEDGDLRDAVDGQPVARGGLANGFRIRAVVDAEGASLVDADIRLDPRHPEVGVAVDHAEAGGAAILTDRNLQTIGERALHHVPWH